MRIIGYFRRTRYWQVYAFNNLPEGYKKKRSLEVPFNWLKNSQFLAHTKFVVPFQNVDLYHSYNSIVTGHKPWVIEVESQVPRFGPDLKKGNRKFDWAVNKLRSEKCKAIIFTSECTKKLNSDNFKKWGIDENKCQVIYRAVEPYEPLQRDGNEKMFTILFVGNAFYRKGGLELLKAFKHFNKDDARLIIISNLELDWAVYPTEEEVNFVRREIEENNQIEHYQKLPHEKVIHWMRKSDVFVSTTHADPFNNTILEALACEVPAITSDVRATPEFIKDGYNGFLTSLDNQKEEKTIQFIQKKLESYYSDNELLTKHKKNAKDIIQDKFVLRHRNNKLKKIYDKSSS